MAFANSIGAACIPLATFPMYDTVGYGWTFSILSLSLISLCIIPLCLYLYADYLVNSWDILIYIK